VRAGVGGEDGVGIEVGEVEVHTDVRADADARFQCLLNKLKFAVAFSRVLRSCARLVEYM